MDADAVASAHASGTRAYVVRDHTPAWVEQWKPVFAEMPGAVHVLHSSADVEVARIDPR